MGVKLRPIATAVLIATALGLAALPAAAEEYARGAALFELCATCHGPDGGGIKMFLAPSIAGLEKWYVLAQLRKFRSGARGTNFDDISGMRMRPMSLTLRSEEDVEAVAGYVASLPPIKPPAEVTGGDPEKGKSAYAATCATCHGAKGEGLQVLNGPALNHASDWYLLDQLMKFKLGIRGGDPRDPIAIMMRPMALALADEQAVKDVVAYIQTLPE